MFKSTIYCMLSVSMHYVSSSFFVCFKFFQYLHPTLVMQLCHHQFQFILADTRLRYLMDSTISFYSRLKLETEYPSFFPLVHPWMFSCLFWVYLLGLLSSMCWRVLCFFFFFFFRPSPSPSLFQVSLVLHA